MSLALDLDVGRRRRRNDGQQLSQGRDGERPRRVRRRRDRPSRARQSAAREAAELRPEVGVVVDHDDPVPGGVDVQLDRVSAALEGAPEGAPGCSREARVLPLDDRCVPRAVSRQLGMYIVSPREDRWTVHQRGKFPSELTLTARCPWRLPFGPND